MSTSDIVDRLRKAAKMIEPPVSWCEEAANEIEWLRRRLQAAENKGAATHRQQDGVPFP